MKKTSFLQILCGIGAVLILNFFLSLSFSLEKWFRISADLIIFLTILVGAVSFSRRQNFWVHLVSLSIFVIWVFRIIDKLLEFTFQRSFTFSDIFLLPELNYLMDQSLTTFEIRLLFPLIIVFFLISYLTILVLTKWIASAFSVSSKRTITGVLIGFGLISLIQFILIKDSAMFNWTRGPLTMDIAILVSDAVNFKYNKEQISRKLKEENSFFTNSKYDLSELDGTNVIVIFVESYGAVLVEEPELLEPYKKLLSEMQSKLENKSFLMVNGYSEAPDSSWLSRLSFSTGTRIDNRATASLAVLSKLTTLNQRFSQLGYHSLSVMPGVEEYKSHIESFFDFQERIRFWDMDWPKNKSVNGWAKIPDQYVLEWLGRKSIFKKNTSVYAEIVLSSSHSPYGLVPHYITNQQIDLEDYWSMIDTKKGSLGLFSHMAGSSNKYMTSIEYSLRSAFEFIEKYLVQDTLIILIGDHQPTALSTYSNLVPVHIISRKSNLLTSFQHIGFRKELFSPVSRGNITHEDFAKFLLQSYSCCKGVID
mgnify:CR=1 FL=1